MATDTVRSTLYLEVALHRALRLKAAADRRSMSDIVNDAVREVLREDGEELAATIVQARETTNTYEALVARLRRELRPPAPLRTKAQDLIEQFRHLPHIDPAQFRADLDRVLDASL